MLEPGHDLYEILGLVESEKPAASIIKTSYRRAALKAHPDKGGSDAEFQKVAFAYAVLSDEKRRKRYDNTGEYSEGVDSDLQDYFDSVCKRGVTEEMIKEDKKAYQGSEEEKDDILAAYDEYDGDLDLIFESIIHSEIEADEARFKKIIDEAIEEGVVEEKKAYVGDKKKSKKRLKKAAKEAKEAEKAAKEIGLKKEDGEAGLQALILKRQRERQGGSFLDHLEEKYAKKSKKGKKRDEPSEEDFLRNRK
ncbi:putative J domain-containing protein [Yarrowia sp. C11]|nr:putative J domain-containing protein [Yarrowia sp. C11]KAG5370868.1 putative J domain-containing protein [Yarrowia sp. E02]